MSQDEQFYEIWQAVLDLDDERLRQAVKAKLAEDTDPLTVIERGLSSALKTAGDKFEPGEFFLMHLIGAAECVQRVMRSQIEPLLKDSGIKRKTLGKVILGAVEGDIHDIGKSIVAWMLFAAGFEILDLGTDVPASKFVSTAKETDADIIGASALLTTTMPMQREIVRSASEAGITKRVRLLFGGAPVSEEWVRGIGGDGYAKDAIEATKVAESLLKLTS